MRGRVTDGLVATGLLLVAACQPALVPLAGPRAPAPMSVPTTAPTSAPLTTAPMPATPATPATVVASTSPAVVAPAPLRAASDFPDHAYLRTRRLMVPVDGRGILDVEDTFDHARSGARVHRAVDVRAPRGTPVLAADDGRVLAIKSNALGGLVVYCTDPANKLVYYYAHLDRYAPGLAEGQAVRQGDVLGFVGTTGNAPPDVPHLHFQVMRLADPARYWDGPALDPRPYFTRDGGMPAGTR
ncbi:MAG: peptidoglycan DD-metalloendopeptidase family protein [Gemmatimonadaceae bacterium]|jgi:murein DD-endopeptidase MepM/ murein hydrolase activator NlpD|nr:peptidoglycan DD-metalloendopeptidase family protein [Gemmatimonadaceae bacterium]